MLDVDLLALQAAQGRGRDNDAVPEGLAAARERVLAMLDDFDRHEGLPRDRVFLGGFSQGAMLACDTVLRSDHPFAGLIILSGSIIAGPEWGSPMARPQRGSPCFRATERTTPYSFTKRRPSSRTP